jgi:hypothetical protein
MTSYANLYTMKVDGTAILLWSVVGVQAAHAQIASTNLDLDIALLDEARCQFQNVRDYECKLLKRERVNGVLLPENVILMRVRSNPFSVYIRCERPKAEEGREV